MPPFQHSRRQGTDIPEAWARFLHHDHQVFAAQPVGGIGTGPQGSHQTVHAKAIQRLSGAATAFSHDL